MKNILGVLLGICMVIGSLTMCYMLGNQIVRDYYLYGITGIIVSFAVGIPLFGLVVFIMTKTMKKLNEKKII